MKKLLFISALFLMFSCVEKKDNSENKNALAELKAYEDSKLTEEKARQLMTNYIKDVSSPEWRTKIPNYFEASTEIDAFMEEHTDFRASFPNYKSTIKHMTMDGNKGIVWMNITANYAVTYRYENSAEVVKDMEAKNQAVSWDEAWVFSVNSDGAFNDEWHYLKDNYKILEDLKMVESP